MTTRASIRRHGRRIRIVAAATVALVVGGAAAAVAADVIYHNGFLYADQKVSGARHSLTSNSARKLGSSSTEVCVITRDGYNPQSYDSSPVCAYVQDAVANHNFCGCKLRYPDTYAGIFGGGTDTRARYTY